ncbi:tyrosine-type recombinase/integrase [Sporosarcina thermotolerans]|uniref:tyrosine-type recombinase/integrase n=1 Tax=Sporosarcina thermotolerans TaxID=633404 RepID=UPI0024BC1C13|nr:tyrosine-type recombinase/integrase [Sporosarcina thermotolerans]WHT49825.1 tyrosine-type recombinase/integrase [Sporosarcina thermotolerans]
MVFEKFLEAKQKQNLRASTLNEHVGLFKSITKFHESRSDRTLYLSDITTQFIADYVYWMKNEAVRYEGHKYFPEHAQTVGLSDATIEGRLKYLKTFVNWCLKEEMLKDNPFNKFEGFRKDEVEIEILTREELNNLLKVVKGHSNKSFKNFRDYVLLHLLVDSMLRITECLLISPHDIDHTNRTIIIRSTNAKSRKARIVPLSNKTYRLLLQLQEENALFEGEVDDLLFLSLSGRMLNNNNVLRDFKKYALEAGITKRFYIHLLRHSAATHYLHHLEMLNRCA